MIASYRRKVKVVLLMAFPVLFFSNNIIRQSQKEISPVHKLIRIHELKKVEAEMNMYKQLIKINLAEIEISLSKQSLKIKQK